MMQEILAVVWGYLAGSLPFAFWLARRSGVDLRRAGSGNVGAANVLRTTGTPSALLALLLDAVKGAVAVLVVMRLTTDLATAVAAGLASMVGHIHPVWLGFRGGKGVATGAGVFIVFAPIAVGIALGVFAAGVLSTRYVSVGSMAAAVALAVAVAALDAPVAVVVGAVVAAAIIVNGHRTNLSRLLAGTERRIGHSS